MTKEEFERLTAEVLDGLPQAMGLDNVEVTLEDEYPEGVSHALALYRGVPLPARHASATGYNLSLPDKIELYWRVFLAQYGTARSATLITTPTKPQVLRGSCAGRSSSTIWCSSPRSMRC